MDYYRRLLIQQNIMKALDMEALALRDDSDKFIRFSLNAITKERAKNIMQQTNRMYSIFSPKR